MLGHVTRLGLNSCKNAGGRGHYNIERRIAMEMTSSLRWYSQHYEWPGSKQFEHDYSIPTNNAVLAINIIRLDHRLLHEKA